MVEVGPEFAFGEMPQIGDNEHRHQSRILFQQSAREVMVIDDERALLRPDHRRQDMAAQQFHPRPLVGVAPLLPLELDLAQPDGHLRRTQVFDGNPDGNPYGNGVRHG